MDRGMDKEDEVCIYIHTYTYTYIYIYIYVYTHTHTHTHTMEYYLAIKMNEMMTLPATWMDLEIIILNEVSQIKTNTIW